MNFQCKIEGKWQMEEAKVAMPSLGFWNPSDYVGMGLITIKNNNNKISTIDPLGFFLHLLYF